jgi:Rod binding domain-containing protein
MSMPLAPTIGATAGGGLPLVNQALEPASVRNGTPATQKAYATALDFEDMLVQQLSQSLTEASATAEGEGGAEGEGSEGGGEAANGELSSLLPQSLTEGVMSQGGLGLAQQLMSALDPTAADTAGKLTATGGASPVPGTPTVPAVEPVATAAPRVAASGGVAA